jgi:hypothetical protein
VKGIELLRCLVVEGRWLCDCAEGEECRDSILGRSANVEVSDQGSCVRDQPVAAHGESAGGSGERQQRSNVCG